MARVTIDLEDPVLVGCGEPALTLAMSSQCSKTPVRPIPAPGTAEERPVYDDPRIPWDGMDDDG